MLDAKLVRIRPPVLPAVHLDQWIWIQLARAEAGENDEWREAHEAVQAAVAKGSCIFPLSMSRLIETCKRRQAKSRGEILDYMAKTWGVNAVLPWTMIAPYEARNAVLYAQGRTIIDLRPHIYGKGMSFAFGGAPSLSWKPGASEEAKAREGAILAMLNGNQAFQLLKDDALSATMAGMSKHDETMAKEMQQIRDSEYSHPDKTFRAKLVEARFMVHTAGPYLLAALQEMVPDQKAWMDANLTKLESIRRVRSSMPSVNTFWTLNDHRNRTRDVQANDINDMDLCAAIPYSAVVATEKQWCKAAQEADLDKMYGAKLVHRPEEFRKAMEPYC
jgi:hypothetical protein